MESSESTGSGSTRKTDADVSPPPAGSGPDTGAANMPAAQIKQKPDATYRHYFRLLQGSQRSAILEYDFERDGGPLSHHD
jgi:hypothetical protein